MISQLHGRGRSWCYYIQAACHAYNTFAHSTLGGYSPFELVYLRKPPDWLGIETGLLKDVPIPYGDYVEQLKFRLQLISSLVLKLHNDAQERETMKHASSLRKTPSYVVGQLVYFLMPRSGALNTNTRKFVVSYVGPIRIKSVLDTTHVILEDLMGRAISGIHHTNRLKPAFIRGKSGVMSNVEDLQKNIDLHFCCTESEITSSDISCSLLCDDTGVYVADSSVKTCGVPSVGDRLWCSKQRFKNGSLQVLFTTRRPVESLTGSSNLESLHGSEFTGWYDVKLFPSLQSEFCCPRGIVVGSDFKFLKHLNC